MKTLKIIFAFLSLLLLQTTAYAQGLTHYSARTQGFWTLGIDGGLAYQNALDVAPNYNGFGASISLGKNLYYRPHSFFSFDLRGRAMFAQSYGLDGYKSTGVQNNLALNGLGRSFDTEKLNYTKPSSIGYYYANYKTSNGNLDLEGVLRFNRLRERTGIVLSLFGGVGVDLYQARIDQRDASGSYAAKYLTIDPTASPETARLQLKNILDGQYETIGDGNKKGGTLTWMPTLGAELGYQFGPRFQASLFHKINYTRTDAFDAQQWDANDATGDNDIQHYTGLKLEWELGKIKTEGLLPEIEILNPERNPYYTDNQEVRISAKISNIKNAYDVRYTLNGDEAKFNFYNPRLNSDITVRPGRNEVEIEATNSYGKDREVLVIFYQPKNVPKETRPTREEPTTTVPPPPVVNNTSPTAMPLPTVRFTNPSSTITVNDRDFNVLGLVKNVRDKNDVRFIFNNRDRDFNFDSRNGSFSAYTELNEGKNELRLEGRNATGKAEDLVTIYYEQPRPQIAAPKVRITDPYSEYQNTENQRVSVKATVENVKNKYEIDVKVNGSSSAFDFNAYRNEVTTELTLREGENRVEISVNTNGGSDKDKVTFNYRERQQPVPTPTPNVAKPNVVINSPSNGQRFTNETIYLDATTYNVSDKYGIRLTLNDVPVNFTFNSSSKKVSAELRLKEGTNVIDISGSNSSGTSRANATVYYEVEKPKIPAPTVRISSPSDGTTTQNNNVRVNASVKNVSGKNQIKVNINGSLTGNYTLNNYGDLTFNTPLREGSNSITIMVENESGKASDATTVIYRKPVAPTPTTRNPDVTPTNDETPPVVRKPRTRGEATPTTEKPTDVPTTGRTPRTESKTNETQQGSDTEAIINITSISKSAGTIKNPDAKLCEVLAKIKETDSKEKITFLVNGKTTAFEYDASSGDFSSEFELNSGKNTITIKVQSNSAGEIEETRTVEY